MSAGGSGRRARTSLASASETGSRHLTQNDRPCTTGDRPTTRRHLPLERSCVSHCGAGPVPCSLTRSWRTVGWAGRRGHDSHSGAGSTGARHPGSAHLGGGAVGTGGSVISTFHFPNIFTAFFSNRLLCCEELWVFIIRKLLASYLSTLLFEKINCWRKISFLSYENSRGITSGF